MDRNVRIAIDIAADAAAAAVFSDTGDAALRMGDDIDQASRMADDAGSRMGSAADKADNLGSSSSQAAGGIGDLGGALSLMPGPLGAVGAGMEAVAPAIMGVTGAADLANLALGSSVVANTKAAFAAGKLKVATVAQTVATRALNLVMRANPIMLAVTAALLLVGVFITLYRKSETFRAIVNVVRDKVIDAFGAMLKPIQWVIDKVQKVVGWIGDAIDATKRALGLGKEYGSTMGRILGTVADDLAAIGQQIRDNHNAQGQGGASGGGVGAPRLAIPQRAAGTTTIDARTYLEVDGTTDLEDLVRKLEDLLRRHGIRMGDIVPGAKVVRV